MHKELSNEISGTSRHPIAYRCRGDGKLYTHESVIIAIERHFKQTGRTRNSPCLCGSGIKIKKCCMKDARTIGTDMTAIMNKMGIRLSGGFDSEL